MQKVKLKFNVDIQDRLIHCQTGNMRHTEFAQGSVHKHYGQFFDKQASLKAMRSYHLSRQIFLGSC